MRARALVSTFSILAVAWLAGCAPAAEQGALEPAAPAVDLAAEEQAIRDLSKQWLAAEQGRDLLTVMSFMDANVTTIFDGRIARGRAEVEDSFEARWQAEPEATIEWSTSAVTVAGSGDLAYERGSWISDPDGPGSAPAENGEYLTVWRKIDGEWKVVADAGSTLQADDA